MKLSKSSEFVYVNGRLHFIYVGERGGRYIKDSISKKYKLLKKHRGGSDPDWNTTVLNRSSGFSGRNPFVSSETSCEYFDNIVAKSKKISSIYNNTSAEELNKLRKPLSREIYDPIENSKPAYNSSMLQNINKKQVLPQILSDKKWDEPRTSLPMNISMQSVNVSTPPKKPVLPPIKSKEEWDKLRRPAQGNPNVQPSTRNEIRNY